MQDVVGPPNIFQSKWSAIKCLNEYTALMLARPSLVTNIPSVFWSISFCIYCYTLGATTLGDRHHRKLLTFTNGESICRAERGWSGTERGKEGSSGGGCTNFCSNEGRCVSCNYCWNSLPLGGDPTQCCHWGQRRSNFYETKNERKLFCSDILANWSQFSGLLMLPLASALLRNLLSCILADNTSSLHCSCCAGRIPPPQPLTQT